MLHFDHFSSDTHFGQKNIIKYSNRPFATVEEMDADLVARWNAAVKPGQTVVHLGDLAMGAVADTVPATAALNGDRYLIPGNHDRVSRAHKEGSRIEQFRALYEDAGWTILDEIVPYELDGQPVLLSHYPYDGDSHDGDRYTHLRATDEGLPIIHGHVHDAWAVRGRQFNVGVDVHDYTPVPEQAIIDWLRGL